MRATEFIVESEEKEWSVTYDIYGSNREKPLYTKTRKVRAKSAEEAKQILQKLVGGTNYRVELAEGDVIPFPVKKLEPVNRRFIEMIKQIREIYDSHRGFTRSKGPTHDGYFWFQDDQDNSVAFKLIDPNYPEPIMMKYEEQGKKGQEQISLKDLEWMVKAIQEPGYFAETKGLPYPGSYEQENKPYMKHHKQERFGTLTTEGK